MEKIFVILYFFVIAYLYGLSANLIFKYTKEFGKQIYKEVAKLCVGFSLYNFFIFVFGTARIPLMPILFFFPPILVISYFLIFKSDNISLPKFKNIKKIKEKPIIPIILIISALVATTILISGTFKYPYLEDGDPWTYSSGAKYISVTKDYHNPDSATAGYNFYLFPHSNPTLAAHYGVLTQLNPDIYWIMKVFINIFILMSFLTFFLFVYHYSKQEVQALIATLLLMITPSFIGHFNFNYTLAISLFPAMLLGASLVKESKKFILLGAILAASILMAHQIAAIQAGITLILFFIVHLVLDLRKNKKTKKQKITKKVAYRILLFGILAILLSFIYYGDFLASVDVQEWYQGRASSFISFSSGSITYDIEPNPLSLFFVAPKTGLMDQQKGIGIFLFSSALLGLLLILISKKIPKKDHIFYTAFFIFFFLFLWVFTGGIFKFSIQNYRWWSVFAISVSLIAGWFLFSVWTLLHKKPVIRTIVFILIIAGLVYTSAVPRYTVQTQYWNPGIDWTSNEELSGFINLRSLPDKTSIYSACQPQRLVTGFGKESFPWIKDVRDFEVYNNTPIRIKEFMNTHNYEYIIISTKCVENHGPDATNNLIETMISSNNFAVSWSNQGFVLLRKN